MVIHLDTSFVVDLIRERRRREDGPATTWVRREAHSELAVATFVLCELEAGAAAATDPARERDRVRTVLSTIAHAAPTDGFAARYGSLLVNLQRAGKGLDTMDLLIATTALEYQAPLVTANRRHFDAVPGLEVLTYR